MPWWAFALASAVAAAATAVLAKLGVKHVPSNLATAVRTGIVLAFAWGIVIARGEHHALPELRGRPLLFLCLSGVATGLSWLAVTFARFNLRRPHELLRSTNSVSR